MDPGHFYNGHCCIHLFITKMSTWLLFWYLLAFGAVDHDIHLSVCDVNLISPQTAELRFKIFYDDLQLSMGLIPGEELPSKYKGADDLIQKFINKNFSFYCNGKKATLQYVNTEAALPAVWCTMRINLATPKTTTLKMENRILIQEFDDQVNIVNVEWQDHHQSYKLDKKNVSLQIALTP